MKPQDFDIHDLINTLRGTCKSMSEALPERMEEEDLTAEDITQIDLEIFKCSTCDWWEDIDQQSEDGEQCNECNREDED